MTELTQNIIELTRSAGADLIGVADPHLFSESSYEGRDPRDIHPNIAAILLIGVMIPKGAIVPLPKGRAEYTNTLMAATATLRVISFSLARYLERLGYLATISPSEGSEFGYWYADKTTYMANFSMKYAAYLAGLGNYGKNHLFLSSQYGSRVRFMAILTDAPLKPGTRTQEFINENCDECSACIRACPVGAIKSDGTISREVCASYMFEELGGLRCGMCIHACPLANMR